MVNIENITRAEENKKLKIKRIKDLLNNFFDGVYISSLSAGLISVSENEKSNPFLFAFPFDSKSDKILLQIPDSLILKYTAKTMAFAEEYEKKFNIDVTLQTDYSK